MPNGLFYHKAFERSISNRRCFCLISVITIFVEIPSINENSADSDQTSRFAASDQDYTVCQCPFYGMLDINGLFLPVNSSR